ncbi:MULTISPECIES: MmcQ/YjbR family DNA-binding protein [Pseudoalteromonas]|uniref:MmcQ/YjbR family DNA-binding protein n=1 Tax=Pseudoalteromonas obscura TaxID=3048491 RepID=A0ABT7EMQ5_9GAMM|nr:MULTISPECIES: MmcQ/YjbR family DNA-binding protein [Pseudoalteromonas]MBQ4838855.1 MmcQ/YjbR family DNA-binding protein [Pseudoalteromonas luteoviolacea]MDK2596332.1 MmcQ/YjbR family DNA-binding protein [Pseudoalteromonas sp. P94(2023)]
MDQKSVHNYLQAKPGTFITKPFAQEVDVYKVQHKMFATLYEGKEGQTNENGEPVWWLNLKCDPDEALLLRDKYSSIVPGYHMNKRLWNTIVLDGSIPEDELKKLIDDSYNIVVDNLPTAQREELNRITSGGN